MNGVINFILGQYLNFLKSLHLNLYGTNACWGKNNRLPLWRDIRAAPCWVWRGVAWRGVVWQKSTPERSRCASFPAACGRVERILKRIASCVSVCVCVCVCWCVGVGVCVCLCWYYKIDRVKKTIFGIIKMYGAHALG